MISQLTIVFAHVALAFGVAWACHTLGLEPIADLSLIWK